MSETEPFGELFKSEEDSLEKILLALLDKENITTKTDIERPLNMAKLSTIAEWLEMEGMPKSANIVRKFILCYLEYRVSFKRQSRKEIIAALTEGLKQEKSVAEKLSSHPE